MIADRQSDTGRSSGLPGRPGHKELTAALGSGNLPSVAAMPEPVRVIFESIYGDAVPSLFAIAAPLSLIVVVAVCLIPNQSLKTQTASERMQDLDAEDKGAN